MDPQPHDNRMTSYSISVLVYQPQLFSALGFQQASQHAGQVCVVVLLGMNWLLSSVSIIPLLNNSHYNILDCCQQRQFLSYSRNLIIRTYSKQKTVYVPLWKACLVCRPSVGQDYLTGSLVLYVSQSSQKWKYVHKSTSELYLVKLI